MGFKKTVEIDGEVKEIELSGLSNNSENIAVMPPMELHGRRKIYTNVRSITRENILEVLNKALAVHNRNRTEEVYLEKYVRGVQPILDRHKVYNTAINNKLCVNMANQIVTFKTAEFAGKPITFVSRGVKKSVPKKIEKLNSMMLSEGKPSKDMKLAYWMFTCGVGYRLILNDKAYAVANGELLDEAPFEIYVLDPRNTFVIRRNDVTQRVLAGVTYVYLSDSEIEYTVYTDNEVYTIVGNQTTVGVITGVTVHNTGVVPILEYPCNSVYMSPLEVVHDLLNALSLLVSNRVDGIEQFIQALMVFEGVDVSQETLDEARDSGVIKLPPTLDGRSGHLYYLNEQLDQSQTQTLVDDIKQTILEIVGMPSQGNANTSDSSNNGAVIMKNGWWNSEARRLETVGMWEEIETNFLKIALRICTDANVLNGLNVSDVKPKFFANNYEDLISKTQAFSTLRSAGCPSIQAFKYSHLGQDPESDSLTFDAYQDEREENLNMSVGVSSNSVTSYGDDEDENAGDEESEESGGEWGVCPVCGKKFKKRNGNQTYDSEECRRIARKQHSGGAFR